MSNRLKLILVVAFLLLLFNCSPISTVKIISHEWKYTVHIMEYGLVVEDGWKVPDGATVVSSRREYLGEKVIRNDTIIYDVNLGSYVNYGGRKTESEYETKYKYSIRKWHLIRMAITEGTGQETYWPKIQLKNGQKEGTIKAEYKILALKDNKEYEYVCADRTEWERLEDSAYYQAIFRGPTIITINERSSLEK